MKKRSVLYTWAIEFAILLALMTAMCITLTFSARRKLLDEYIDITDQQQDKIEIALKKMRWQRFCLERGGNLKRNLTSCEAFLRCSGL